MLVLILFSSLSRSRFVQILRRHLMTSFSLFDRELVVYLYFKVQGNLIKAHFLWLIMVFAGSICLYGLTLVSWIIPCGLTYSPSHSCFCIPFGTVCWWWDQFYHPYDNLTYTCGASAFNVNFISYRSHIRLFSMWLRGTAVIFQITVVSRKTVVLRANSSGI